MGDRTSSRSKSGWPRNPRLVAGQRSHRSQLVELQACLALHPVPDFGHAAFPGGCGDPPTQSHPLLGSDRHALAVWVESNTENSVGRSKRRPKLPTRFGIPKPGRAVVTGHQQHRADGAKITLTTPPAFLRTSCKSLPKFASQNGNGAILASSHHSRPSERQEPRTSRISHASLVVQAVVTRARKRFVSPRFPRIGGIRNSARIPRRRSKWTAAYSFLREGRAIPICCMSICRSSHASFLAAGLRSR